MSTLSYLVTSAVASRFLSGTFFITSKGNSASSVSLLASCSCFVICRVLTRQFRFGNFCVDSRCGTQSSQTSKSAKRSCLRISSAFVRLIFFSISKLLRLFRCCTAEIPISLSFCLYNGMHLLWKFAHCCSHMGPYTPHVHVMMNDRLHVNITVQYS